MQIPIQLSPRAVKRLDELANEVGCPPSQVIKYLSTLIWDKTWDDMWLRVPPRARDLLISLDPATTERLCEIGRRYMVIQTYANNLDCVGAVLDLMLTGGLVTEGYTPPVRVLPPKTKELWLSLEARQGLKLRARAATGRQRLTEFLHGHIKTYQEYPGLGFAVMVPVESPPYRRYPLKLGLEPYEFDALSTAAVQLGLRPPHRESVYSWASWLLELWGLGSLEILEEKEVTYV